MKKEIYYELECVVETRNAMHSLKEKCDNLDEVKEMLELVKYNYNVLTHVVTKCEVTREIVRL